MTAPIGGRIKKIHVPAREQIEAGDLLYTLDPATGASTEVVAITGVDEEIEIMGLGFTDDGTLYATSPESELFYTIDLATGDTTVVGEHGLFFPHGGDIPMVPQNVSCEAGG